MSSETPTSAEPTTLPSAVPTTAARAAQPPRQLLCYCYLPLFTVTIYSKKSAMENNFTKFEKEQPSPDILRHLTQLVADMGQDRDDLLVHVSKLEHNQQTLLSELHLLKKQNAALVHQNNLRHLASTMHAGNEEYCTLSGALEETPHKSPPPTSTKVPDTPMKDDQEILHLLNFEDDIPGVECRQEATRGAAGVRILSIPVHVDDNEQFDPQEAEALFQAYRMNQGLSCPKGSESPSPQ